MNRDLQRSGMKRSRLEAPGIVFFVFDEAIKLSTACLNSISVCQTALGLHHHALVVREPEKPTGGERMPTSQSRWKGPFGTEASGSRSAACGVTIIMVVHPGR